MKKLLAVLCLFLWAPWVYGADTKLQNLTATTTPVCTDVLFIVVDPAGTPLDRKVALTDIECHLSGAGAPGASTGNSRVVGKTDYFDTTGTVVYDLIDSTTDANVWRLRGNVNAAAALTSTAFVTGGGTSAVQTPSATSTLDASGNAVFAGSVTADSFALGGASSTCDGTAGCFEMGQGTAPSGAPTANAIREYAPTGVTAYSIVKPGAAATGTRKLTNSSGTMTESILTTGHIRGISFTIGDPAGSALTAAATTTAYVTVPFACTLTGYALAIDAGTITVKFWKIATGTAIPTASNSINTSGVGISSGTAVRVGTLPGDFTASAVSVGDIMAMNVITTATAKMVNGVLECTQ